MLTPETVHYRRGKEVIDARRKVLVATYAAHPERFVRKPPQQPSLPETTYRFRSASYPPDLCIWQRIGYASLPINFKELIR